MRLRPFGTIAVVAVAAGFAPPVQAAQRLYVSHFGSNDVAAFTLGAGGAVTPVPGSPFATQSGSGPRGIASTADGRFLYAGNSTQEVEGFASAPSGRLTVLASSPFHAGTSPNKVAITPDRRFLFAANGGSGTDGNSIARFAVLPSGALSSLGAATPAGANPGVLAVAGGGRYLYTAANSALNGFAIGANGSLTQLPGLPLGLTFPRGLVASPDGRRLYVALGMNAQVAGFAVGAGGALTPLPGSPYGSGGAPEELAMAPNGRSLYVGRAPGGPSSIDRLAIAANGSLTPGASVPTDADIGGVAVSADSRFVYGATTGSPSKLYGAAVSATGALGAIAGLPRPSDGDLSSGAAVTIAPDQPAVARLSGTSRRKRAVAFDARGTTDPDGAPARYDWAFGDGTGLADGGPTPKHTYPHDGTFTATVVVTDDLGCATTLVYVSAQATCNGGPGARAAISARADGKAPKISRLKVGKRKKGKSKVSFKLSERATLKLKVERRLAGRKVGRKCRKPSRKNRTKRRCARFNSLGTISKTGKKGNNKLTLGKRYRGKKLKAGSYRLTLTATDVTGNRSKAAKRKLTVPRAKRRH